MAFGRRHTGCSCPEKQGPHLRTSGAAAASLVRGCVLVAEPSSGATLQRPIVQAQRAFHPVGAATAVLPAPVVVNETAAYLLWRHSWG